jgi:hypothetical protein
MVAALEAYRLRVWRVKVAEGVGVALFGLAVSYLVVFGLDRWGESAAWVRGLICFVGSLGLWVVLPWKVWRWVWRHRRPGEVARLIRHKYPRFGDHFLGVIELASHGDEKGVSRELVEAAVRQVDGELQERDLRDAVPAPRHRLWGWLAGVPVALVLVVFLVVPAAGWNTLVRWGAVWSGVERYTFAQLEDVNLVRVVPYAEPFRFEAKLREGSPWRPGSGRVRVEGQEVVEVAREGEVYRFSMPPQTKDGWMELEVGDSLHRVRVEPRARPALVDVGVEVRLPEYLERPEVLSESLRGGSVRLVEGSRARFEATATRELAAAYLDGREQGVEGDRLVSESVEVRGEEVYSLTWRDTLGLEGRQAQELRVVGVEDGLPVVTVSELRHNQIVLASEVLTFEVQAGDDFGVRRVGLEWEGVKDAVYNPEPATGEKLVAVGGAREEELAARATFSAEGVGMKAQSIRLRAFAEDYRADGTRAYSPALVVHVVDEAEHFEWLTGQMNQWVGAAREVYERELQLERVNEELRAMPPEALDDPVQRRRIMDQAEAERANAAQLGALVRRGKDLVREAGRNREFDAEKLESWAQLLFQLEGVASEQMPSVSALLRAAVQAPGVGHEDGEAAEGVKPGPKEGEQSNQPGMVAGVDRSTPKPGGPPSEAQAQDTPGGPAVVDRESGYDLPKKEEGEEAKKSESAPSAGGFGLPTTTLGGGKPGAKPAGDDKKKKPKDASELVGEALEKQKELLASFAKVADEMSQLLLGFENSTFVKRLKSASRTQLELALALNDLDGFGLEGDYEESLPQRRVLGERELGAAEVLYTVHEDLVAYAERRPSDSFDRVLAEMRDVVIVDQLKGVAEAIGRNEVGQSTIDAEYWSDTLDRWAEELAGFPEPGEEEPPSESEEQTAANLTPEIVLEVLRMIHREMELREEVRELDQASGGMELDDYVAAGNRLAGVQDELSGRARAVVGMIQVLPDADKLEEEMRKVGNAAVVMNEVEFRLRAPETGAPTIAAISEVIEILLETTRAEEQTTVVSAASATAPALMLLGTGDDEVEAYIEERAAEQSTGTAGRLLPEEFRQGLDVYLNALEGRGNHPAEE